MRILSAESPREIARIAAGLRFPAAELPAILSLSSRRYRRAGFFILITVASSLRKIHRVSRRWKYRNDGHGFDRENCVILYLKENIRDIQELECRYIPALL